MSRSRRGVAAGILVAVGTLGSVVAFHAARGPDASSADAAEPAAPTERVRVEVLNAGGVPGVARTATGHLRDAGFDVVQFGNAGAFDRDSSVVIDRVGRTDLAEAVANALGIGNVLTEPDPNLFVDVTVLLGKEWSNRAGQGNGQHPSPPRTPWDPRGWFGR